MLNKKFMVLAIFFITLVAVSAVSAAEDVGDVAAIETDTQTNVITNDTSTDEMQGDALEASANDESEDTLDVSEDVEILTGGSNCYVNGSYTGDVEQGTEDQPFKSLKHALYDNEDRSIREDGDIIHIAAGTYANDEEVDLINVGLTIDKNLTLKSWGPGQVIFDAQHICGIFTITADEFNVDGITFANGLSEYGGALNFINGLKNSHIGGTFIDNYGVFGGAINVNGNVEDSIISAWFNNNIAMEYTEGQSDSEYVQGHGGAISVFGNIMNSLIDGDFANNVASMFGGAIFAMNGIISTNVSGNFFRNNSAVMGGAIYAPFMFYSNIKGDFENNTALAGGSIFTNVVNGTTIDSSFANNTADSALASDYPKIINETIEYVLEEQLHIDPQIIQFVREIMEKYKIDPGFGGAVSILGILENSTITGEFTNNTGADAGGAVCVLGLAIKSGISGQYELNRAMFGGSVFLPIVEYSNIAGEFVYNFAVQGGALFAVIANHTDIKGNYMFNGATVPEDYSEEGFLAWGGALCIDGALENSNIDGYFINNTAIELGGAIGGIDILINSNIAGYFINNTAKIGGAIDAPGVYRSTISGYFINNTASVGGAIFTCYLNNTEIAAHFVNNTANRKEELSMEFDEVSLVSQTGDFGDFSGFGGAVCILGIMENTVFTGDFIKNHAIGGGAIFAESLELNMGRHHFEISPMVNNAFNSNFVGNVAYEGAAIFIGATSSQNKFNSNFIDNYAMNDGIIYLNNESAGDLIFNCLFMNNIATNSIIHIENADGTNITNNIFLNPLRAYDIYHNGGSDSKLRVNDNWFGHNATNYKTHPKIKGTAECNTWLFLAAAANPASVSYKGSSNIVFNLFVYNKVAGASTGKFNHRLLEPITLAITSTNGKVNKKAVSLGDVIKFSSNGKKGTVTALIGNAFDTVVISCLPRLSGNNLVMDYLGNNYRIRVYGADGNPIAGQVVKMTVNGVTYSVKSDKNGYAKLLIRLKPKTYTIISKYKGVILKNTIKVKNTLKVKKSFNVVNTAKKLVLKATLKWSNGKAIVGKKVSFKIKGKKFTVKTDKNGLAKIKFAVKIISKYNIKLIYKNNSVILRIGKKYKMPVSYKNETTKSKLIVV